MFPNSRSPNSRFPNSRMSAPARRLVRRSALCLIALSAALAPLAAGAAERNWQQSYPIAADGALSLSNINGDVTIRGTSGDQITVTATIKASKESDLDTVDVDVDAGKRHVRIETDYSKKRGRWGNSYASVEYDIEVPKGIELEEIELVNGSLELSNLSGRIEASLVNGSLEAEGLSGSVELETVNGRVEATFDDLSGAQRIDLESVNGSIQLNLPDDVDATIDATTVHGKISNDFGLRVDKGEYVGSDLKGTLGSGAARISLENVNGSIKIRRN